MPHTEADTCRVYVVPKLQNAGWSDDQIVEKYFTDGRIIAYLELLQTRVDELEKLQVEAEQEMEELISSILDRAIDGEL